jgi:hypothetical protein
MPGEGSQTLRLFNVSSINAGDYYVKITNACGMVYSEYAVLMIQEPPTWDQVPLPQDQIIACGEMQEPEILTATGNFGAALDVDFQEVISDILCPGSYILTRTWEATDTCGFTISYTQIITVEDTQAPTLINPEITCQEYNQSNIIMNLVDAAAFDATSLVGDVAALYQDDCSELVVAELLNIFPGEENSDAFWSFTYEFSISDACGNPTSCEVVYSGGLLEVTGLVVTNTHCYGSEGVIIADDLTVEPSGDVTLIAGISVQLKPGVQVLSGGRLHAYISNQYCENQTPLVASQDENILSLFESDLPNHNSHSFKLYPNPTTGLFTLEFINTTITSPRQIEIYGMLGELILSKEISGEQRWQFNLADRAKGIYIVRVVQGSEIEITKVVKR